MTGSVVRVVFLISVSLTVVKSGGQVWPLDMANNSVDDSYEGCRDAMNQLVTSQLITEDEKRVPRFKDEWEKARQNCTKDGLPLNQSAAIYLYTKNESCVPNCSYKQFNEATRNGATNYTSGNFSFYTLHFFLTDAIQQLKKNQTGCVTTYRRTNVTFQTDVLNQTIRFDSFASSSFTTDLIDFGNVSCFNISTCFGADVTKYSANPHEHEVLIPPYEKFNVTGIKNNTWCDVVYELKSVGKVSNLQCAKSNSTPSAPPPSINSTPSAPPPSINSTPSAPPPSINSTPSAPPPSINSTPSAPPPSINSGSSAPPPSVLLPVLLLALLWSDS